MEWLRHARDPFGQKMLVGVAWELLWLPFATAAVVIAVHLALRARRRRRERGARRADDSAGTLGRDAARRSDMSAPPS